MTDLNAFAGLTGLEKPRRTNWQGLLDNILRKGTPDRPYLMELFRDGEISNAIATRFDLLKGVKRDDPFYELKHVLAVNRFVGWDYIGIGPAFGFEFHNVKTEDTAALSDRGGRTFRDEHTGPIASWDDFEKFKWPDTDSDSVYAYFEWCEKNLPDDMCVIAYTAQFCECISWLLGYETLCYKLFDDRKLVKAISDKLISLYRVLVKRSLQFGRVKMVWGTDDMGFKTGLLISADDMREFVLPGHKMAAAMTHEKGGAYLLHSCGQLRDIIDDLADDVKIDAKHSFEDTIEDVRKVKHTYGKKMALIGGIDMDFMCRSTPEAIRKRVRDTLDVCLPGGGYCLGTGNSVANYIPLDNYLALVDEGLLYGT